MEKWKGIIISESLKEPSIINKFHVYKVKVSKNEHDIDKYGNKGRWHLYWVYATKKQIEDLKRCIKQKWYVHFWQKNKIIAVFYGKSFEFLTDKKQTWKSVLKYGISIGIKEEQLDFPIE